MANDNPFPFAPVIEKFSHFDRREREHIYALVSMYSVRLNNPDEEDRWRKREKNALHWVLETLMELEDTE